MAADEAEMRPVAEAEEAEDVEDVGEVAVAEVAAEAAKHRMLIKSEANLPLEQRSFGPLLIWSGSQGRIPYLLFRPTRYSLEELYEELPHRASSAPWNLSVTFYRTEVKLLQTILEDHGFSSHPSRTCNLLWCGSHVKPALLLGLGEHQKVNHFPRIHDITRKDLMARTLNAMRQTHGALEYDFIPTTFVLPADTELLVNQMQMQLHKERATSSWIVKPIASSRGRGISIVQQPHQLPQEDVVVSRYISNPLLVDGYKFDLRIYVAVTSFEPLRAYIFDEAHHLYVVYILRCVTSYVALHLTLRYIFNVATRRRTDAHYRCAIRSVTSRRASAVSLPRSTSTRAAVATYGTSTCT